MLYMPEIRFMSRMLFVKNNDSAQIMPNHLLSVDITPQFPRYFSMRLPYLEHGFFALPKPLLYPRKPAEYLVAVSDVMIFTSVNRAIHRKLPGV